MIDKITKIDKLMYGGTMVIETELGLKYTIDNDLFTNTPGMITIDYPDNYNDVIFGDQESAKKEIIDLLERYQASFKCYDDLIKELHYITAILFLQ
jgi:hypothetical protein